MNKFKMKQVIGLIFVIGVLAGSTTLATADFNRYWVIEYDENYFDVTYQNYWIEYDYDTLKVTVQIFNLNRSNCQLNFYGELIDLVGLEEYSIDFQVSVLSHKVSLDNIYREARVVLLIWNSTSISYEFLAEAAILRTEEYKTHDITMDFPFIVILAVIPLFIYYKKRR